jgi:hypothetical protein
MWNWPPEDVDLATHGLTETQGDAYVHFALKKLDPDRLGAEHLRTRSTRSSAGLRMRTCETSAGHPPSQNSGRVPARCHCDDRGEGKGANNVRTNIYMVRVT